MIPMRVVPLFGSGLYGKSAVVTRQKRLNCYMELREDGDKTKISCYGTPGLVAAFTTPTPAGLPVRGILGTQNSLYLVAYNQFQSVNSIGTSLFSSTIGTTSGQVSLAASPSNSINPSQVLVVDGVSAYLYNSSAATFTAVAASFPNGAKTCTFVSGFFVAEQPGTPYFWVSNAFDGTTWGALGFAAASAYSDTILAVDNLQGNLVIFSQLHTEFWQDQGLTPQPFAPILSAANEYGLAAVFSREHVDQTLIFLAQNKEGAVQFVQLNGFSPSVISNPDLEYIINGFSTVSDAVSLSYERDKHKFYQVTFPTANRSFLFDCATRLWSDVQTGSQMGRHWGNLSAYYAGQRMITDYATNQVYTLSDTQYTDNGQIIARELVTRHVLSQFNRIRVALLYIDMETGVGLQTGQGVNPQIMLQYSKDNGRTWSAERWVSSGLVGNYIARVIWRRFGSTRDATFRIRMTDPVKFVVTEGAMRIRQKAA